MIYLMEKNQWILLKKTHNFKRSFRNSEFYKQKWGKPFVLKKLDIFFAIS